MLIVQMQWIFASYFDTVFIYDAHNVWHSDLYHCRWYRRQLGRISQPGGTRILGGTPGCSAGWSKLVFFRSTLSERVRKECAGAIWTQLRGLSAMYPPAWNILHHEEFSAWPRDIDWKGTGYFFRIFYFGHVIDVPFDTPFEIDLYLPQKVVCLVPSAGDFCPERKSYMCLICNWVCSCCGTPIKNREGPSLNSDAPLYFLCRHTPTEVYGYVPIGNWFKQGDDLKKFLWKIL